MNFTKLTTHAEVLSLIEWHNWNSEYVVLDTETTGLNRQTDKLLSIQLTGREPESVVYIDNRHTFPLFSKLRTPLVLQNFKFDFGMLANFDPALKGLNLLADTALMHHLLDEEASHSLDSMVKERYNDSYKDLFWSKYKNFQDAPEAEQIEYSCKDIIYTDRIYKALKKELADQGIPQSLIDHVHRLALSLYKTEMEGIAVDLNYLTELATELKPKILQYRHQMRAQAETACNLIELDMWTKQIEKAYKPTGYVWKTLPKPEFNWSSHAQVGELLYDRLALPEQQHKDKKTKQWRRSVNDESLQNIEHLHPLPGMLRQYAEWQKVYTAFIEGTLERVHDGRIYPSFNVNGTVTGRISGSDPNLHQMPSKGDWAKVRGIYVPDLGYSLATCDYRQLEVVIAAHYSQDPNLLKIVFEGASKHDITAQGLGIERGLAKTVNFAMQYLCGVGKIAQLLNCSKKDAEFAWNKYWETYAGEKRVVDECKAKVDKGEAIVNPFGRRRHFKSDYSSRWQREAAYRQAYSSLIQGTGSDCTHYAFYTADTSLRSRGYGKGLFEVHDEIVISAKNEYCAEARDLLQSAMIEAGKVAKLTVPLTVKCSEPLERWAK